MGGCFRLYASVPFILTFRYFMGLCMTIITQLKCHVILSDLCCHATLFLYIYTLYVATLASVQHGLTRNTCGIILFGRIGTLRIRRKGTKNINSMDAIIDVKREGRHRLTHNVSTALCFFTCFKHGRQGKKRRPIRGH